MPKLSILIPARNEMFLAKTIENILENIEDDTEIIAVLDGAWADPPIHDHPRVTLVYLPESIGQRAATNLACKLSTAKYVMKCDAHCAFDKGFDRKLMETMQDDWTVVPMMYNLHAFDWVCECGERRYQGRSDPCEKCGKQMTREILWQPRLERCTWKWMFDKDLHFQYWSGAKRTPGEKGIIETMSILGACFMLTREKYWELNICDESFGSWGQQGTEVSSKTWLSGGKVMVNQHTWFAHMFRTQGGDFGFPYPISGKQVDKARKLSQDIFLNNKFEKQVFPMSYILDRFWPIPGWTEDDLKAQKMLECKNAETNKLTTMYLEAVNQKGIVYYTDNKLKWSIAKQCRDQIKSINLPIVSVSLKKSDIGVNFVLNEERSILTMFKQILKGLEESKSEIIFLCEHDVFYSPTHFDFSPPKRDIFYYNINVVKMDYSTGKTVKVDFCQQTSGLCAYRDLLLDHYRKRVSFIEKNGYNSKIGYEPGGHNRKERIDDFKAASWYSKEPNVDIRHDSNLTRTKWDKESFRNKKFTIGWTEGRFEDLWCFNVFKI